ncbi:MAG: DUF2207 domain-containing protein [Ruthenibacterium sp.]
MFKRLCCALAAVLALAVCAVPVFGAQEAEAAGYSITSFEGSAVLHENAVMDVTETIVVDFSTPSHGIYRALQTSLMQEKTTGGQTVRMPYRARVTDVQVDGVPFETFSEDGVFSSAWGRKTKPSPAHRYTRCITVRFWGRPRA